MDSFPIITFLKRQLESGAVVPACNPCTLEAEAGSLASVQSVGLYSKYQASMDQIAEGVVETFNTIKDTQLLLFTVSLKQLGRSA